MDSCALTFVDNMLFDSLYNSIEFKEFNEILELFDSFYDDTLYMEAMDDPSNSRKKRVDTILTNTASTTKEAIKAYNIATDIKGLEYKSIWDLCMALLKLGLKCLKFVIKFVTKIPNFITSTINKISGLGETVKAKIRGDIQLYITIDDLRVIYNNTIINKLDTAIGYMELIRKGDTWSSLFNKGITEINKSNDMSNIRKVISIFNELKKVSFHKTTVNMKNKKLVDAYFGNDKICNFYNFKNKRNVQCSYLESLRFIAELFNERSTALRNMQVDINDKLNASQSNSSFNKLDRKQQETIRDMITSISKIIQIIGNITKYIMEDTKVINNSVEKVTKLINEQELAGEPEIKIDKQYSKLYTEILKINDDIPSLIKKTFVNNTVTEIKELPDKYVIIGKSDDGKFKEISVNKK